MENDDLSLLQYGVEDGTEILMEAIDPEKERKDAEKRERRLRSLKQQQRFGDALQEERRKEFS